MIPKTISKALAALPLLALPTEASAAKTPQKAPKPNIIMIYIDDMGYGDLSCYGGNMAPTPNIDRLAAQGKRFTQFYVASPISSPSRVGITTGMFPTRWGITTFLNTRKANRYNEQNDFLSTEAPSLARQLKSVGYATGHFGKWHMGGGRDVDNAPSIREYGFDEYASTWESPDPDPLLTASDWIWSNQDSIKRWNRTAYFIDRTLDFLRRHKGQPCYVNLWPDDVHAPWVPNSMVADEEKGVWVKQSSFVPVLTQLDVQIGRFIDALHREGLDENTIILFSSDNGPDPSFGNKRTVGLKGQKGSLYEGGIREPFFVRWEGHIASGEVDSSTVMASVDIFPTLCAIAGAPLPSGYKLDGVDMCDALLNGNAPKRATPLCWEYGKNFKPPAPPPFGNIYSPHLAIRDGDWKLIMNDDGKDAQLYDMAGDPMEKSNVAAQNPKVVERLQGMLMEWYKHAWRQFADK